MIVANGVAGTLLAAGALSDASVRVAGVVLPAVWVELLVMAVLIAGLVLSERARRRGRPRGAARRH